MTLHTDFEQYFEAHKDELPGFVEKETIKKIFWSGFNYGWMARENSINNAISKALIDRDKVQRD